MLWTTLHIIDLLLWLFMAASVMYVVVFAVVSLFKSSPTTHHASLTTQHSFLVLFPAYHEDAVIVHSVMEFLKSDYPKELYHVAVISDHMTDETNQELESLPITLLQPVFEKSSKARALQYAIDHIPENVRADHVVILDADNVVKPDFLTKLDEACARGYKAIQCHRCAKNANNDVAVLDGVSEEINNTIFRRAHNVIGMSSALIGSGMCFEFQWFKEHVGLLNSAVEDRELEAMLMKERIFIKFENDILVYDEKVSNSDNFQRQRLRWMNGQFQTLLFMLPYLPNAFLTGNINYIDKTIQQALIPRSMLVVAIFGMSILMTIVSLIFSLYWYIKWGCLFLAICFALYIATPKQLRSHSVFGKILSLPMLVWKMVLNLLKIDRKNTDFIHTTHE